MSTRERLIDSTRELLWERGYVGTSPKAILARADAGQGSMYHHFTGKSELALAAITRTAEQMREGIEDQFSMPGSAFERITAYLLRERDVLRGCPIGGLAQDPDVAGDPALRTPVDETLGWLRHRLAGLIVEGQAAGELGSGLDPENTAATLLAVLQGGYVLARASDSPEPFAQAVEGALTLLRATR